MSYTIAQQVSFEQDIKKSRFQAFAFPVQTEEECKELLLSYKDTTTTHQCWAWKIGHTVRFNDDGEPSGTAGRPILATIEGNDLTNILLLVNRWFGGVKLGTGGLVRAYGGTAGQCLTHADKVELILKEHVYFTCLFNEWPIFQYELMHQHIDFDTSYQAQGVDVIAWLQPQQIVDFSVKIQDITRGREQLKQVEHTHD